MNWKASTIALACSYLYLYIRVSNKFDNVPHTLKIGLSITILAYAFNAFLISRTLKKEFLSIFKAKESSNDFKKFLHNLPEGISIIDDSTQTFKFFNVKLKETLDMKSYLKSHENIQKLEKYNKDVNEEYLRMMDSLENKCLSVEESPNNLHNKQFTNLMEKFSVKERADKKKRKHNFRLEDTKEDEVEIPLLEFLQEERRE